MTVDLLPTPSAAPHPDGTAAARPSRSLLGGWHERADVEQDCPYCAGPETD